MDVMEKQQVKTIKYCTFLRSKKRKSREWLPLWLWEAA